MSDVPQTPEPTTPSPTQTPSTTPPNEPAPAPQPNGEPAPEAAKSLLGDPVAEAFDPEKLALPENFDKTEHFDHFNEWAKEVGINQPQAQKLLDLYKSATEAASTRVYDAWTKQNETWQNDVKNDQELGGNKLDGVRQTISKLLDNPELSDPKLREALDYTGAGNNPAVIRTLYRWAQKLTEGAPIAGNVPARDGQGRVITNGPIDLAKAIYGPNGPFTGGPNLGRN